MIWLTDMWQLFINFADVGKDYFKSYLDVNEFANLFTHLLKNMNLSI